MSILAQIIGLACLLFWGFWLCCKLRLPAGFAPLCGLCFCMVVLQLAGSCQPALAGGPAAACGGCAHPGAAPPSRNFAPAALPGCAGLLQRCWGADGGVRHPAAGIPDLG